MKIRVAINAMICNLHCPGCGHDGFFVPKKNTPGWKRCRKCGVDVRYENTCGIDLSAVLESCNNPTNLRFRKAGSK